MESYKKLLAANRAWVRDRLREQSDFFHEHANVHEPEFLWIGCSDSRVPAEDITGAEHGELFVHRNIANLVVATDFNLLSVLQYAVEVLRVRHVIVCGHYECGGVGNAMANRDLGLINQWLHPIKDVYRQHAAELDAIVDGQARYNRLVELNTAEQVRNLARTAIVQRAWREAGQPVLHGWVYDMHTGFLKQTAMVEPGQPAENIFQFHYPETAADE